MHGFGSKLVCLSMQAKAHDNNKHTSLIRNLFILHILRIRKNSVVQSCVAWGLYYKAFNGRNLRIFVSSTRVGSGLTRKH
jgi:hypothetical protein